MGRQMRLVLPKGGKASLSPTKTMRRRGDFFDQIADVENLRVAFYKAASGKHQRRSVKKIECDLENNLKWLYDLLINGQFHTAPYHTKVVREPKTRLIYILPFWPDRVVQHAILNVLAPYWESLFIKDTYSCIKGRGQHKGSDRTQQFVRHYKYVYKADVKKFYPSLNHEVLKSVIRKKIKDKRLLAVLDDIIDSAEGDTNVPIGNLMSQWFGNLYLNELDMFVKHKLHCKAYVRYCDDFVLFSNNKRQLWQWAGQIETFARDQLRLTFSKADVFPTSRGVDFLGYRHFPAGFKLIRKATVKRMRKNLARVSSQMQDGTIDPDRARGIVESANGWAGWANSYNLMCSLGLFQLRKEAKSYGMKSFSELSKRDMVEQEGEKLHINDVLGKEIIVTGFDMRPSVLNKQDYMCLKFTMDGEKRVLFTNSDVLRKQCIEHQNDMPFKATIIQKGKYYKFT